MSLVYQFVPRLLLLTTVLVGCGGTPPDQHFVPPETSQLEVTFRNDLGESFVPKRIVLTLDGQSVHTWTAIEDELNDGELRFPAMSISGGEHQAGIRAVYHGMGHGVFSYIKNYLFNVRSTHEWRVPSGRTTELMAICFEQGGPATPLSERPQIRWVEKIH